MGRFADLRIPVNDSEDTVNRNRCRPRCVNTVSIPRETVVKKYPAKRIVIVASALYNQRTEDVPCPTNTNGVKSTTHSEGTRS